MLQIREEQFGDELGMYHVNEQAFGSPAEADVVDTLRRRGAIVLSMVALESDTIVGHVLFTEAIIDDPRVSFKALGLAPMAVLPEYQRRTIGSQLLRASLDKCRQSGYDVVIVLGHPGFYPRFGFVPAKQHGIECEFDVPDNAFMILELRENALAKWTGIIRYQAEFRKFV
jgi:putative acetyltransferase